MRFPILPGCLIAIGLSAWPALADGLHGPVTGFVLDGRTHTLRPINGVPGAAVLGTPVTLPISVGLAAVSTRLDFALVTDMNGDGTPLLAQGLISGSPQVQALRGTIPASLLVLSSGGTTAGIYSKSTGQAQIVTGLPGAPKAWAPLDVSGWSGVAAMAIDATGSRMVLAGGPDGSSLYKVVVDTGGANGPDWLASVSGASAAAFLPGGNDVVVGSSTGDITLLQDIGGSLVQSKVSGAASVITSAAAIQALSDHEIVVIDGPSGAAASIDLQSGDVQALAVPGAATRCEPLDGSVFVLNQAGSQPLLLLDTAQGRAVRFVPAD